MSQEFTGANFAKALADGALTNQVVREGLAKPKDKDPNTILFSEGDCTNWIPIPVKMLDRVEFIRTLPCKDHEHPFVRIHLKSSGDNPEAEVFARLLASNSPLPGAEFTALAGGVSLQQAGVGDLAGAGSVPAMQPVASPEGSAKTCYHLFCWRAPVGVDRNGKVIWKIVCYDVCL